VKYKLKLDDGPLAATGSFNSKGLNFRPLPWWKRWAFRIVARHLMKQNTAYQCMGKMNWGLGDYDPVKRRFDGADIQVPGVSMAHWILREAGYGVCEVNVIEWYERRKYKGDLIAKYYSLRG
jgi:hypothetical protein